MRKQSDFLDSRVREDNAHRFGKSFDPSEDATRQEFKDEQDINVIVRRLGGGVPLAQPPQFGEADYDVDLHRAFILRDELRETVRQLPPEFLKANGGVNGVIRRVLDGDIVLTDEGPEETPPGQPAPEAPRPKADEPPKAA